VTHFPKACRYCAKVFASGRKRRHHEKLIHEPNSGAGRTYAAQKAARAAARAAMRAQRGWNPVRTKAKRVEAEAIANRLREVVGGT
jgi:hypothetical protein